MAREVFRGKVHIGYLAAIVAASNAGGSGSVVGDTTTTMMWIDGVSPLSVLEAYRRRAASPSSCSAFRPPCSSSAIRRSSRMCAPGVRIDWTRVFIVFVILVVAILANVIANLRYPDLLDQIPVIGLAVWAALLVTALLRRPDWEIMPETFKGTIFLLALVLSASLMPVEKLPAGLVADGARSWLRVGRVRQHPADGAGAEAGRLRLGLPGLRGGLRRIDDLVRLIGRRGARQPVPEAKSVGLWLRHGWHVTVAYVIGFFVMLSVLGWHPDPPHRKAADVPPSVTVTNLTRR